MIPFIRSLPELMAISSSRDELNISPEKKSIKALKEGGEREKENKNTNSKREKKIILPELPKKKNLRWIKSKEVVSKLFDEFDYNNQIQSLYDLTLLDRQRNYDEHDVA